MDILHCITAVNFLAKMEIKRDFLKIIYLCSMNSHWIKGMSSIMHRNISLKFIHFLKIIFYPLSITFMQVLINPRSPKIAASLVLILTLPDHFLNIIGAFFYLHVLLSALLVLALSYLLKLFLVECLYW